MRHHRIPTIALCALILSATQAAATRTFYIAANGNDTNAGTSKTAPWLHAPGMVTCTAVCAATTPAPGDSYILRGGDTWHYGNAQAAAYTGGTWVWSWSGISGTPIYIGVDTSWFAGGAWTRPILTGDGTYGDNGEFFDAGNNSNLVLDNIEFTGLYWDSGYTN